MLPRLLLVALMGLLGTLAHAAEPAGGTEKPDPIASRAVMTGEQVVQILDETVDWYRTLGMQQQAATQPSDLLILYANRQTADKVIALAFEIARAKSNASFMIWSAVCRFAYRISKSLGCFDACCCAPSVRYQSTVSSRTCTTWSLVITARGCVVFCSG